MAGRRPVDSSRAFGCRRRLISRPRRGLCSADRSSISLHPTSSSHGPLQPRQHPVRRLRSAERLPSAAGQANASQRSGRIWGYPFALTRPASRATSRMIRVAFFFAAAERGKGVGCNVNSSLPSLQGMPCGQNFCNFLNVFEIPTPRGAVTEGWCRTARRAAPPSARSYLDAKAEARQRTQQDNSGQRHHSVDSGTFLRPGLWRT